MAMKKLLFVILFSLLVITFSNGQATCPIDENFGYIKPEIKNNSVLYSPVLKISQYIFPALKDMQQVFKKEL